MVPALRQGLSQPIIRRSASGPPLRAFGDDATKERFVRDPEDELESRLQLAGAGRA
jgi:hypothetical protein